MTKVTIKQSNIVLIHFTIF